MARILIIDDDKVVPVALQIALSSEGHDVEIATDADAGLALATQEDFDVVVSDLHWNSPGSQWTDPSGKRPEKKGIEVLDQLHRAKPHLPVILMTAYPDSDSTIRATRLGASDYLTKPPIKRDTIIKPGTDEEMDKFADKIRELARTTVQEAQTMETAGSITASPPLPGKSRPPLVGRSLPMQSVYKQIGRVAAKPVTVLVRGETGTGKELVARALHEYSDRSHEKFIVVNCPAIPASLLESELFGHEAGAFTDAKTRRIGRFEQADRGTIFLDEIGDMDVNLQQKLLRVLQERTIQRIGGQETLSIDVRVVAATHRDLEAAMQEKRFRQDLYYRLNDAVIRLPPLRERLEDVPDLVRHFLQLFRSEVGTSKPTITEDAIKSLQQYPWPGNVRELKNVIHKALLLARGFTITRDFVQKARDQVSRYGPTADTALFTRAQSFPDRPLAAFISELLDKAERGNNESVQTIVVEAVEREMYSQALHMAEGDQTKAAQLLGVSRPTMREKLTRYCLLPTRSRAAETAVV